ncbi:hypothetical protein BDP27DRAFT_1367376 [Rhodocollybia butyracea]|uniref:Uncharacterized protein n=1 Tax=Rhodocollybia butyracea TaxID=206335 RepID=A0A9P5PJ93_9AGAR|nr:hypothetical protein BDP27DRAFT_1367376 [Rhodocollybia butyracea]
MTLAIAFAYSLAFFSALQGTPAMPLEVARDIEQRASSQPFWSADRYSNHRGLAHLHRGMTSSNAHWHRSHATIEARRIICDTVKKVWDGDKAKAFGVAPSRPTKERSLHSHFLLLDCYDTAPKAQYSPAHDQPGTFSSVYLRVDTKRQSRFNPTLLVQRINNNRLRLAALARFHQGCDSLIQEMLSSEKLLCHKAESDRTRNRQRKRLAGSVQRELGIWKLSTREYKKDYTPPTFFSWFSLIQHISQSHKQALYESSIPSLHDVHSPLHHPSLSKLSITFAHSLVLFSALQRALAMPVEVARDIEHSGHPGLAHSHQDIDHDTTNINAHSQCNHAPIEARGKAWDTIKKTWGAGTYN